MSGEIAVGDQVRDSSNSQVNADDVLACRDKSQSQPDDAILPRIAE